MPTRAVIHTATGVVRRCTTDPNHRLAPDESFVTVADGFDLGGGFWTVDAGGNKAQATQAEVRQAGMDGAFNASESVRKRRDLVAHLTDMDADITLPPKVRRLARVFLDFLS